MAYLTLFFVFTSVLGGALSYKASTSLPGEAMYPYKVEVNERIESFVANTDEARARWNLAIIKTRLAEARTLAKHNQLDFRSQNQIADNLQQHIKAVTLQIEKLQQSGSNVEASKLAQQLYQTLDQETQKVADVSALGSTNLQISLAPILTRLRTSEATVALISTKANATAALGEHAPAENIAKLTSTTPTPPPVTPSVNLKKREEVRYFK